MERFNKLTIAARYYLLGKKFLVAADALEIGLNIHTGVRKDGVTPEFMHQLQIFHYLRTLESSLILPEETYIAAFLHDSIEDYNSAESALIIRDYPDAAMTALKLLDKTNKTPTGYFEEIADNCIASIVKCADRAHNMSTMVGVFTQEKQLKYMEEVETYFMPMIKRARRGFPSQEPAYENVKHVLNIQMDMLEVIVNGTLSVQ